jgi:hypothetical protein
MYTLLLQSVPPNAFVDEVQPVGAQGISAGKGLYVPAPHAVHTADVSPSPELNEPAAHVVNRQALAPGVATYLAWVHSEQVLAPPPEMEPARHEVHTDSPVPDANVPAAQAPQTVWPVVLAKVPARQEVQVAAVAVLYVPVGQTIQLPSALHPPYVPAAHEEHCMMIAGVYVSPRKLKMEATSLAESARV